MAGPMIYTTLAMQWKVANSPVALLAIATGFILDRITISSSTSRRFHMMAAGKQGLPPNQPDQTRTDIVIGATISSEPPTGMLSFRYSPGHDHRPGRRSEKFSLPS